MFVCMGMHKVINGALRAMHTVFNNSVLRKKPNENAKLIMTAIAGVIFGLFLGVSFQTLMWKPNLSSDLFASHLLRGDRYSVISSQAPSDRSVASVNNASNMSTIRVLPNPRGAERLPPGIIRAESDLYRRRLWGNPDEDLKVRQNYLVAFTVGYDQRHNIDAAIRKFSENFTIVLFHYDGGRTNEWDQFEWSKRAIHVSAHKQTKWWFAKRFLHPDIVAAYEYIFIWDEDLGVDHFNAEEYIRLAKKYDLEISQPALQNRELTWQMTERIADREVHKSTIERPGWCSDPHLPPCAAFVEIMAPVFSRDAWRCVWHMIQNDLVHGWGLDLAIRRCVEPAHEKIGVVDSQWIVHHSVPSLGRQGQEANGKKAWQGVRERCEKEWSLFRNRIEESEKTYFDSIRTDHKNLTGVLQNAAN